VHPLATPRYVLSGKPDTTCRRSLRRAWKCTSAPASSASTPGSACPQPSSSTRAGSAPGWPALACAACVVLGGRHPRSTAAAPLSASAALLTAGAALAPPEAAVPQAGAAAAHSCAPDGTAGSAPKSASPRSAQRLHRKRARSRPPSHSLKPPGTAGQASAHSHGCLCTRGDFTLARQVRYDDTRASSRVSRR